jgi:hypothetical protein
MLYFINQLFAYKNNKADNVHYYHFSQINTCVRKWIRLYMFATTINI